ncbi:TPA: type 1 fimbrial major subunit FimA [Serratia marcescens]|uniref:type 1 fimbrial major subunit FimA n=1 Tax=Serratia marcescens TaxID=615 RepID=UPI002791E38C|nr:type 1 fimbrial major subunit FimA [Serratia marcescens]MDP8797284.1 type 1 fimbrial major subunit FimA [Serratia marcescens]HEJ7138547.1 type 1 fimbrial major subunit FimA [Serratia marcescens]HEJ7182402.1 type 1 fimbrial major subunit FimA [Serratia marcescens]HEJ7186055.1 type 1 fimbrial major subunit FimA [Serratia marcescens]HEJ7215064.1 type 1 fimbrial major subunit FimA [Serratia marcescens]
MLNKQRFIKSVLGLALLSAGTVASAAIVTGGTVHFTGEIVDAACAVSADSVDQTVKMGQYRTKLLEGKGTYSTAVPFTIKLEDCDTEVSKNASVAFYGNQAADDATVLAVSNTSGGAAGAANGVGIEIRDYTDKVVEPNGNVFSTAQKLVDGSNVLSFSARYKSTAATVSPGAANADATFKMQYN